MNPKLEEWTLILKEVRRTFKTTGAITPSSRWLARSLVRQVAAMPPPRRVLEIGPGTGAVTTTILKVLGETDQLEMVELNPVFVSLLKERFQCDPEWARATVPYTLHEGDVLHIEIESGFDAIVSTLPFNNFPPELVEKIIVRSLDLLRPGGFYSFFEYFGVRPVKMCFVDKYERTRLRGVGKVLDNYLSEHEAERHLVIANMPPALTHHLAV